MTCQGRWSFSSAGEVSLFVAFPLPLAEKGIGSMTISLSLMFVASVRRGKMILITRLALLRSTRANLGSQSSFKSKADNISCEPLRLFPSSFLFYLALGLAGQALLTFSPTRPSESLGSEAFPFISHSLCRCNPPPTWSTLHRPI